MRICLIVNPVASSMTDRRRAFAEASLRAKHCVETVLTTSRSHASDVARTAADAGAEVVVVAAGDGTLNEAANGLVGTATALAPLPGGSTNVFARAIGYGNRFESAVQRLLVALAHRSVRRIGLGSANDRHFLFHLGAGFDATVVERVERSPWVKRYAAHPAFAVATVACLARGFDRRVPSVRVVPRDPPDAQHESFFTVVSNVAPYTFVGPRRLLLTRDAALDRPLAATSLTRFHLSDVAVAFGSALGRARHLGRSARVVQLRDLVELSLLAGRSGAPFPWQADGDYLGTTDALSVRYVPDALALVVPG